MSENNFDLVVIGAGPGGYVAAIRAAQLGLKICVIEANHLGGICLNWGCIPTKALLRAAEIKHLIERAGEFGIEVAKPKVDFAKVIKRSRDVASKLSGGINHLMKKNNIKVIDGFAVLKDKNKLSVTKNDKEVAEINFKYAILATGAKAKDLPMVKADGQDIWTYKEAMSAKEMPKNLLIIGAGAIGVEFASFYNALGCDVTLIEAVERILPAEDVEISNIARKLFEKHGIKIHVNSFIKSISKKGKKIYGEFETNGKKSNIEVDKVILATGVKANIENIGLEKLAIKIDSGAIITDEYMKTSQDSIYAIGDVTSPPWLAHKASHEAVVAAEKIAAIMGKYDIAKIHPVKKENIPGCTYSNPQVASVGFTEKAAKEAGYQLKIGRFPYMANGKAIALGETDGLIKTIFDKETGELLGAHIIGAEATEMIQVFVLGKTMEAVEEDFMNAIFAHPTLGEMIHESVLDAFGKALHI